MVISNGRIYSCVSVFFYNNLSITAMTMILMNEATISSDSISKLQMTSAFSGVDVLSAFREVLASEPSMAVAMAAIKVLMKVLEKCSAGTLQVR